MAKENNNKVEVLDAEELASFICGIESEDSDEIDKALFDKFEISFDKFHELLSALMPALCLGISPLTEKAYIGFSKDEKGHGVWLVKKEVDGQFIAAVIGWLGGPIQKGSKGFERVITANGKPEYKIAITTPAYNIDIHKKEAVKKEPKEKSNGANNTAN